MGIPFSRSGSSGQDRKHENAAIVSFVSSRDNQHDAASYGREIYGKDRKANVADVDELQKGHYGPSLPKLLNRRKFMFQSMKDMVNSCFIYACVVDLVTRAVYRRATTVHEQEMYGKEQEIYYVKRCVKKFEEENHLLKHRLHSSDQKILELSRKIEQAERHNEQISAVDSGSYQDEASTPMLLHSALESVTRGISIVVSELVSQIKQKRGSIAVSPRVLNPEVDANNGVISLREGKIILHSVLGNGFFHEFDSQFSISSHTFEKPKVRKRCFFQTYKKFRDLEPKQILQEDEEFRWFVEKKRLYIGQSLLNSLIAVPSNDAPLNEQQWQQHSSVMIHTFCMNLLDADRLLQHESSFARGFLRLSKCVWLLYKLVFSFEPTAAEIFTVPSGSVFDEEYMEDMMKQDDYDDSRFECEDGEDIMMMPTRHVKCMCTPGFTVRNTIVKARVFVHES